MLVGSIMCCLNARRGNVLHWVLIASFHHRLTLVRSLQPHESVKELDVLHQSSAVLDVPVELHSSFAHADTETRNLEHWK